MLAAREGLRTIVVELGDQHRLPILFGASEAPETGVEVELEANLWSISIDPDRALLEWLRTLAGRLSARMLAASTTFHYFAAAAPGAKELVSMVKVHRLLDGQSARDGARPYDLVVLDAPATGHALAMLGSPQTFASIVRVGPLAEQAQGVLDLLGDPGRSAYVAVAQGTEMAVTETLELEEGLRRQLDRDLDTVVVNGILPRRFTRQEMERIDELSPDGLGASADVVRRASRAAHATYERTRLQQSQIARLRRQRFAEGMPPSVVTIPFLFTADLGLEAVRKISVGLERKL
jgi:anion-transporting  ArsA/GET3 family ATPase